MRPRRTAIVVAFALALAGSVAGCSRDSKKATGPSGLPAVAQQRGIAIGAEFVQVQYPSAYYREQATDNFTSITPNRSFKWQWLEPEQGAFDFAASDLIMQFAAEHHLRVRGCCLAWGANNPAWLENGHWTKAQAEYLLHKYISTVVGRYAGRVAQWDVVNEGLYSTSGTPQGPYTVKSRRNVWARTIGPEYIALAFRWAHEADPHAQLFYNDFGAEAPSPKFNAELLMVKTLKAHRVPINGVGLQTHRPPPSGPPYYPTKPQVQKVLGSLGALGMQTELTELDQPLPLPAGKAELVVQGSLYEQMVTACLSVATCTGVTVWGIDDNDRYAQLRAKNLGAATLFSTSGQVKPAFRAVLRALRTAPGPAAAERSTPGQPA